jgi:hypothetical protein
MATGNGDVPWHRDHGTANRYRVPRSAVHLSMQDRTPRFATPGHASAACPVHIDDDVDPWVTTLDLSVQPPHRRFPTGRCVVFHQLSATNQ